MWKPGRVWGVRSGQPNFEIQSQFANFSDTSQITDKSEQSYSSEQKTARLLRHSYVRRVAPVREAWARVGRDTYVSGKHQAPCSCIAKLYCTFV